MVWAIAGLTILGILLRPRDWPEAIWACLGAVTLVGGGWEPWSGAGHAILRGSDVYLFLSGMMLLAEFARRNGVFDWLAMHAVESARGSKLRLFTVIYAVGTAVTVLFSNDATAVVLTPAVAAAVRRTRAEPLPYLLICAFIANAASFVLPISNPANLVVFGQKIPALLPWLERFLLPSILSIGATFALLWLVSRKQLKGTLEAETQAITLNPGGRKALWALAAGALVMTLASLRGMDLGWPTLIAGLGAVAIAGGFSGTLATARGISWSVLPLVAGLFVMVDALNRSGATSALRTLLAKCETLSPATGRLLSSFGMAGLSNAMNNLPSGLLAAGAIDAHVPDALRSAILIGVDLGPNLSVTGSLATVLWLIALRREGIAVTGWQFLRVGLIVMPPALILATLALQ